MVLAPEWCAEGAVTKREWPGWFCIQIMQAGGVVSANVHCVLCVAHMCSGRWAQHMVAYCGAVCVVAVLVCILWCVMCLLFHVVWFQSVPLVVGFGGGHVFAGPIGPSFC